ncbi:MAG: phosphatidylserine decarboxylase family protein [Rikenellaceae bacterium]
MKIHKEGHRIVACMLTLNLALTALIWLVIPCVWINIPLSGIFLFLAGFAPWFFRQPNRKLPLQDNNIIYAPADGKIVAIEEVEETEYLKEKCLQVSVFMSVWNVHMNWYPTTGEVKYYKYHPGLFLVAWLPKSSTENERTTTVVDNGTHKILFRQIAGLVARRIVNYSVEGDKVSQNQNCGFIKFGSRVDLYLPLGSKVDVKIGDKTVGTRTIIAHLPQGK